MGIFGGLKNALKGIGGEYEINRIIGAGGAVSYIVGAHTFIAWNMSEGREFDLTAYSLAYPAGLAAVLGATAGAVALKDRFVATSTVIRETGAVPVAPPAGPEVKPEKLGDEANT